MFCIFCGNETEVYNSRPKTRTASVWRRRACKSCVAQFTTEELPDYSSALLVSNVNNSDTYPFSRDKLYLSIYKSLGHRKDAIISATALTHTVIGRILYKKMVVNRSIRMHDLATVTYTALKRFDPLAAASYKAYHQSALKK